jgi:ribosomal protein S18 acetylase RimI-like enzyme
MPAGLVVRPLTPADAPECDRVLATLPYHFGDPAGQAECRHAVRSAPGYVATLDGQVVGFLTLARHYEESAEITWLAVAAQLRGRGIGRALVSRACDDLRAEGRRLLLLFTLSDSVDEGDVTDGYTATRAFYRALGFSAAREIPELWPGSPALLFVKAL